MDGRPISQGGPANLMQPTGREKMIASLSWCLALVLVAVALYLLWPVATPAVQALGMPLATEAVDLPEGFQVPEEAALPEYAQAAQSPSFQRRSYLHTVIPQRLSQEIRPYTVQSGDSVFEIARQFDLRPESILWANYEQLNDNPDLISVGMELQIPPVDGVLYQWQAGDTLETVASRFEADVSAIINLPGNHLDLTDPTIETGQWVVVPGGHREFRQWLIPTIPRGSAGVSRSVYGDGACEGNYSGALGTGTFMWPTSEHRLSGNDYWSGHLGIDIAVGEGQPVSAADGGVVVFAGWANGGYGTTVMIDHGNGYQTLYGHLSRVAVACGRSVVQGAVIAYAGNTGNSTGPHLHFEVRYMGGFISPWFVLP